MNGVNFGQLQTPGYAYGAQEAKMEHKEANFVEVFPYKDGQVLKYSIGIFFKDNYNRSEFGRSHIEFQFSGKLGDVLVGELRQNPGLLDRLILAKFSALATREIKPWKELAYLPPDLDSQNRKEKLQILATR